MVKMKNKNNRQKNRKKIVPFIFFLTIILLGAVIIKTDIFYIKEIIVQENSKLSKDYIVDATDITRDDNIFLVELKELKKKLEGEIYIESVDIGRKLPDKLVINVKERKGKISYNYNLKKYLLDFHGVVLEKIEKDEDLFIIESELETNIILGEIIYFKDKDIEFSKILYLSEYIYENNRNLDCNILIKNDNIYCIIEKDTYVKFNQAENLRYQYEFGIDIIEKRTNEGLDINGVIDFTKGDNPIYIDFKDLEEEI